MHDYTIYGHCLRSEIPVPELRPVEGGCPFWHFRRVDTMPDAEGLRLLGEEHLYAEVWVRLFAYAGGHRVVVDDTGLYDIAADGRIAWSPMGPSWPEFVRAHLLGRVLATDLHFRGVPTLHGSGVAFGDQGVAFLAPKHFGKTTLALTLARAGADFLTDDTLPVQLTPRPTARPGVHSLRIHRDVGDRFGMALPAEGTPDGKYVLHDLPQERLRSGPTPLAALYLLEPTDPLSAAVSRIPLPQTRAAAALMAHMKIGRMLGRSEAPTLLRWATRIATQVPVYRLQVPRGFDHLPRVVEAVSAWHMKPPLGRDPS